MNETNQRTRIIQGANRFEARLQGYKGGEGIIEFAQSSGRNTQVMVVISGLKENSVSFRN